MLSGNRNFEARIHPEVKANYLASPPLVVAYALAGRMDIDLADEPLGQDDDGNDVFLHDIWPTAAEVQETDRRRRSRTRCSASTYADVFTGDDQWRDAAGARGRALRLGRRARPTCAGRRTSTACRREPGTVEDVAGARCLVMLGDSVTTDHISPAGSIKPDSPAGRYLIEHGVERKDFNSYGSRRGNHEVMVRGTFANVRLRNLLVPGTEGTWTVHLPSGEEMTIFERLAALPRRGHAADRARRQGVRLRLVARLGGEGPEPARRAAVIAESYERIHRSNLLMMGILPLQFLDGETPPALGLTGRESFSIEGVENARGARGDRARRRHGLHRARAARHAARARVPPPRRDPAVRACGVSSRPRAARAAVSASRIGPCASR